MICCSSCCWADHITSFLFFPSLNGEIISVSVMFSGFQLSNSSQRKPLDWAGGAAGKWCWGRCQPSLISLISQVPRRDQRQCPGSTLNLYLFYGNFKHDHNEIVPKKEVEKPDTRILNYSLFYPVILFGSKYLPLGKSLMMHYVRIIGRRVSVHRF